MSYSAGGMIWRIHLLPIRSNISPVSMDVPPIPMRVSPILVNVFLRHVELAPVLFERFSIRTQLLFTLSADLMDLLSQGLDLILIARFYRCSPLSLQ